MRAVIQRVRSASVTVDGAVVSRIGRGLVCFIGVKAGDTRRDAEVLADRIVSTRVFPDDATGSNWKQSLNDIDGECLCVSNFTLYARCKRAHPDFSAAMRPDEARRQYQEFLTVLRARRHPEAADVSDDSHHKVHDGVFGALMDVSLVNDGPVTLTIDSDGTIGVTT